MYRWLDENTFPHMGLSVVNAKGLYLDDGVAGSAPDRVAFG